MRETWADLLAWHAEAIRLAEWHAESAQAVVAASETAQVALMYALRRR